MVSRRERAELSTRSGKRFNLQFKQLVTDFVGDVDNWNRIELSTRDTPMIQDRVTITRNGGETRITTIYQPAEESAVCDLAVIDAKGTVSAERTHFEDGKPHRVERGGSVARQLLGRLGVGDQNISVVPAESAA